MELDKKINFIAKWIKDYAIKSKQQALIVGVSGGIDSALTSLLCAKTKLRTIAVSIPIHQHINELNNSNIHLDWLCKNYKNVQPITIELTKLLNLYTELIPKDFQTDLGFANSRSRMRMMTLYQIASKERGLVVGTGNKVEDFGIGFFTKYGDGGVDISPIADLTKTEVRELAKFCQINQNILSAPPTDGLWQDEKTDEDQIGASYEELEWAMEYSYTDDLNGREKEVLEIYRNLNEQNQHKINPIPVCKIPK